MRKSMFVAFVGALALLAPVTAEAKSYNNSGGSGSCLTSEARALLGRIQAKFGRVEIISTDRKSVV